jgi:endoglucanase
VTHVTEDGFLRFAGVGGIDCRVLPGKRVFIGAEGVPGVIGIKPFHLTKSAEREKAPEQDALYIDIGAMSRDDALTRVCVGDFCAFDPEVMEFGDKYLAAKAIDDRFGCAVLINLLESNLPLDCSFAFTVQEEVGTRGAATAAYAVAPDIAIVLEATTAADLPGVDDSKTICKLGGGAVAPFMDGGTVYDRELWSLLRDTARERGILWQTKEYISGGTDAAVIHKSRAGVYTAAIAAPVRNLHSPSCVAKISDLEAAALLTRAFLDKLGEIYG